MRRHVVANDLPIRSPNHRGRERRGGPFGRESLPNIRSTPERLVP
jgi:hypothetical protein